MFKDVYLFLPPCAVLTNWVGHLWSTGLAIISNRGVSEGLQGRKRRKVSQRKKNVLPTFKILFVPCHSRLPILEYSS